MTDIRPMSDITPWNGDKLGSVGVLIKDKKGSGLPFFFVILL